MRLPPLSLGDSTDPAMYESLMPDYAGDVEFNLFHYLITALHLFMQVRHHPPRALAVTPHLSLTAPRRCSARWSSPISS